MPKPEILSRPSAEKIKFVDRLKDGKPGDFVSYKELSDLVNDDVQDGKAYQSLRKARHTVIREHSLVWHPSECHTGLKCLTATEITALGEKDRQKIRRAAGRGLRRLQAADCSQMSQSQMLRHVATITHLKVIQLTAARKKREKLEEACAMLKPLDGPSGLKALAKMVPKNAS